MPAFSFTPPQQTWLLGLLIAWAVLLFGGFVFGRSHAKREGRMPTWTRLTSSAILVVAAWSWCLAAPHTPVRTFSFLIAAGMTLGAVGDFFMAGLLPIRQPVLGGIAAFGLGHVAYIAAGLSLGAALGLDAVGLRLGAWAVWLLIGFAGWYFAVFRGQEPTRLRWAALPYALLLSSTAGVASGLASQAPAFLPFALGAALFLLSDLILAARLFAGRRFALIDDAIWLAYGPGQMLIVYTTGSVLLGIG